MQLSRRDFAIGCSCSIYGMSLGRCETVSGTGLSSPICGTIDAIPGDDDGTFRFDKSVKPDQPIQFGNKHEGFVLNPQGVSFARDRWRGIDSIDKSGELIVLGVFFINGSKSDQEMAMDAAHAWTNFPSIGKKLKFRFDVPREEAQIRVEFATGEGNWSFVGRNCLRVPPRSRTMSIDDLKSYVCEHEFGHAICLQHEQQFPGAEGIAWNEQRVIDDCKRLYGWSEETTRANVLSKFISENAKCIGDQHLNPQSIMMYMIPAEWTTNGFSSSTNTTITDRDVKCVEGVYSL